MKRTLTYLPWIILLLIISFVMYFFPRQKTYQPVQQQLVTNESSEPEIQQGCESAANSSDQSSLSICHFAIHPELPIYTFHLNGDKTTNLVETISIYTNDTEPHQSLQAEMDEPPISSSHFFTTEDVNFDGYQDLKLLYHWGASGNTYYHYWLFDPTSQLFQRATAFDELSNPTVFPETKTISTFSVGGMAGCIYFNGTYAVDPEGNLSLLYSEGQDWVDEIQFKKTITEVIDGQPQVHTELGECGN